MPFSPAAPPDRDVSLGVREAVARALAAGADAFYCDFLFGVVIVGGGRDPNACGRDERSAVLRPEGWRVSRADVDAAVALALSRRAARIRRAESGGAATVFPEAP